MKKTNLVTCVAILLIITTMLTACRKNSPTESSTPSISEINSINREHMAEIITRSREIKMCDMDLDIAEREIAHATHYEMDMKLDVEKKKLSGHVIITIKNSTNDEISDVVVRNYAAYTPQNKDVRQSTIGNFKGEGGKSLAASTEEDPTIIRVDLLEPIKPNEETTISFDFENEIPQAKIRYGYVAYDGNLLFQLSFCFPSLSVYEGEEWNRNPFIYSGAEANYTTVSDYDVRIQVPDEYIVVATGQETTQGNGEYCIVGKNLREFALVIGNNLKKSSAIHDEIEISNYYYDYEGNKKYNEYSMKLAQASFELYSQLIGEYPYEELDVVSVFMESAMEYPGLVMIGYPDAAPEELKKLDIRKPYGDIMSHIPHEIAHQWFYGGIGNDPYKEPWLDEAFAEFFESYVFPISGASVIEEMEAEKEDGTGWRFRTYIDYYWLWTDMAKQIRYSNYINLPYDSYGQTSEGYSHHVYQGGAMFLYELEQVMGEPTFFAMLQCYYKAYQFSEVTTKDFVEIVKLFDDSERVGEIVDKYINLK